MDKRILMTLILMEEEECSETLKIVIKNRLKRNKIFEKRRKEEFFKVISPVFYTS